MCARGVNMLHLISGSAGGLLVTSFDVFIAHNDSFVRLKTVKATEGSAIATIVQDWDGTHLTSQTSYVFKALALQPGVVCDAALDTELLSEALSVETDKASVPDPPLISSLRLLSGCTVMVVLSLPNDFCGAAILGYSGQVTDAKGVIVSQFLIGNESDIAMIYNLEANTEFAVVAQTVSDLNLSKSSPEYTFISGNAGTPSKVKSLNISDVGWSSVLLQWEPPEQTGCGQVAGKDKLTVSQKRELAKLTAPRFSCRVCRVPARYHHSRGYQDCR